MKTCLSNKTKGVLSVIAGLLIHCVLGSVYSFILLSPFLLSYLHSFNSSIVIDDGFWFFPISIIFCTMSIAFGGKIEKKFGPRL